MQIPQRQHGGVHWHGQGWSGWSGWGTPKAVLPTSFPHTARADASTVGFLSQVSRKTKTRSRRAHPKTGQQRDEAGASIGGDHPNTLAHRAKAHPPPSLPARAGLIPRSPPKTQAERDRAGASLGGEQPIPSRKARKLILPRASSASEGLIPRSYRECPLPFPAGAAG